MKARISLPIVASLTISLASLACTTCGPSGACSPEELTIALANAGPGDTVRVGSCEIAGAFVLPGGVSLEGVDGSVLSSMEGGEPVLRADVAGPATVRGLSIDVDHGGVGVRLGGDAEVTLEGVDVRVTRGIGVGLAGAGATLRDVTLVGVIRASNAFSASSSPLETSAYGLVGRDVGGRLVRLEGVHASGFSVAAVTLRDANVTWQGSDTGFDVEATRGVGVALFGGTATFTSVAIGGMLAGAGLPGVALAVGQTADGTAGQLDAYDLLISGGAGHGLFADHSDIHLEGALVENQGLAGLRIQGGSLDATNLTAVGNGGAGLVAIDTVFVSLESGRFENQLERPLPSRIGSTLIGDGIQITRDPATPGAPSLDLTLTDVDLLGNERAGLVIDAADGPVSRLELAGVTTMGMGTSFGAVTVRTAVPAGWDAMVSRDALTMANDASFPGTIDVLGIMMPPALVAEPPPL